MDLLEQYFSRYTGVIYFFLYNDDKNICDNITWERENIKVIGLVGPMGKMGVSLPSCCDPFCWLMVLNFLFGPSTLVVCGTLITLGMMT